MLAWRPFWQLIIKHIKYCKAKHQTILFILLKMFGKHLFETYVHKHGWLFSLLQPLKKSTEFPSLCAYKSLCAVVASTIPVKRKEKIII